MTSLLNDALSWLLGIVGKAFAQVIGLVVELILSVPGPDLSTSYSGGFTPAVADGTPQASQILSYAVWVSLAACALALIVTVGSWAWASARGEPGDGAARLLKVGAGVGLVSAGMAIATGWASSFHRRAVTGAVGTVQNGLFWYAIIALAASLVVGGAKMAWDHRGQDATRLFGSIARFAVTSTIGVTVISLGLEGGTLFAKWMVSTAMHNLPTVAPGPVSPSLGGAAAAFEVGNVIAGVAVANTGDLMFAFAIIVIIVVVVSIVVALVGFVILVALDALLVVMAGVLPLASSFTYFKMGQEWFDKIVGWCIAFVLYKPAMAIIYATAFALMQTPLAAALGGHSDALTQIFTMLEAVALTAMATLALPALMRLAVPAVAAASGASLGGVLTAVAGGAMMLKMASGAAQTGGDVANNIAAPTGAAPTTEATGNNTGGNQPGNNNPATPGSSSNQGLGDQPGATSAPADMPAPGGAGGAGGAGAPGTPGAGAAGGGGVAEAGGATAVAATPPIPI